MRVVTYKYKVYSQNRNHQKRLENLLCTAASIYNHCICLYKRYYKLYKKTLPKNKLQSHIAKIKNRCHHQWKMVDSMAAQQITDRIYNGYSFFFKRITGRPPTYKSWRKYKSITYKTHGWKLNGNIFRISNIKLNLKFHQSRNIEGKIQNVTLKRDAVGDWWLFFLVHQDDNPKTSKQETGKSAGFDFGLKHFLTNNEGEKIESPRYLFHSIKELKKLSKEYSVKKRGSNGKRKARIKLARFYRSLCYKRDNFYWNLSNILVSQYDIVCFETLDMKYFQREYGKKIGDFAFTKFVKILSFMCAKYNKRFVQIDRWETTSKTCSVCGYKENELDINTRIWLCPYCGTTHDRDVNAAKNILRVGISTLERERVNPTS